MLFELFMLFFKIGAFTIGGGYAMVPLIQEQVVEEKKWLEEEEFIDLLAICESTPGPIAVNTATYVGYKMGKLPGVIVATLGVILPSFLIIFIITKFLWDYRNNLYVARAFEGIRVAVFTLILNAWWKMSDDAKKKPLILAVMAAVAVIILRFDISPIILILIGGVAGIIVNKLRAKE